MIYRLVQNIPFIIPIAAFVDMAALEIAKEAMPDSSLMFFFRQFRFDIHLPWYFYNWAGYLLIAIVIAILLCFFEKLAPKKAVVAIALNVIMSFLFLRHIIANI